MRDLAMHSPVLLCLVTVIFGAASSLLPVSPVEPILLGVAAVAPLWLLLPLVLLATASHMSTKTLVFLGAGRLDRVLSERQRERLERARARLAGRPRLQQGTLLLSSVTGVPPFYLTTVLCGSLRMPLRHFLVLATTGRGIRFAALLFLPQLFHAAPLGAQSVATPPAVDVRGTGPDPYVLISGMVGGVAGFRKIAARLVGQGKRVITIDPYQLSIDSSDVTFNALARRVDRLLGRLGATGAHIVGHAHGGGVALRLAANFPARVSDLYLLDVGALARNRSAVFGSSLRLVPLITRLPGGRRYIRGRFLDGLRDNSGRVAWVDESSGREYADPMLDHIRKVIALAVRLAAAEEPEPVESVIARVRVPVTAILGALTRPAGPSPEELRALEPLGARLSFVRLHGVGHFPHEEAPDDVVRYLLRSRALVAAQAVGA